MQRREYASYSMILEDVYGFWQGLRVVVPNQTRDDAKEHQKDRVSQSLHANVACG